MNIKYLKIFIRKITFKKLLNTFYVNISYYLSVFLKYNKRLGFPVSISIEPTATCNLQCPECPSGTGKLTRFKGNIDFNLFKKIIDDTAPYLMNLILYFQGEPFINNEFLKLVEYASLKKKIYTTTSTNGHYINSETVKKIIKSGLDKIIFSLDGTTQEIYEQYRKGGNLEKVKNAVKDLVYYKKIMKSETPLIELQFLVFKFNEHQIEDFKKLKDNLGADKAVLKTAQIYDFEKNRNLIPTKIKYSRYKKDKKGNYVIKNKLKNHCKRLWESSVITNTGEVLPCCFDKDAKYSFGNLKDISFSQINNNEKSLKFRKLLLYNRRKIDICKNCTEGLYK